MVEMSSIKADIKLDLNDLDDARTSSKLITSTYLKAEFA